MSKTKSVVKHRYFKGQQAKRGAGEYTRYVEYREGRDLEKSGREFFTGDRENIKGSEVRELWREQSGRGPVMHELILSPGLNCVENQEYTRELMDKLERSKGQELQWYAVEHKNTDHHHIHVLIAGTDAEGRQVRIDRNDHKQIKEWGDRYIEREHQLDRYLDRELDRLVTAKEYTRDRGDALFDSLFGKDHQDAERGKKEPDRPIDRTGDRDQVEPRKEHEPLRQWTRADIDFERIDDEDKISLKSGGLISKYDSSDHLKDVAAQLKEGPYRNRLEEEDYSKMWSWIGTKETAGENFYGRPPLKDELDRSDAPRREIKEWDKDRAIAQLADKEKIHRDNESFTKYSSLDELKRLEGRLEGGVVERVTKQEYAQLKQWISEKERHGEDYHDRQGRAKFDKNERDKLRRKEKKLEKEREKQRAREAGREFNELDKKYRESFQDRSGVVPRRMGRLQRIHEQRGRLLDAHTGYQLNQDRQRMQAVKDAMERDPENMERYEKELEWLNEAYREQMKEFEKLDLGDLLGDKEREKNERGGDKKDGKDRREQDREEGKEHTRETDETTKAQQETLVTADESEKPDQETKPDKEREEREEKERERERERESDDEGRGW